jgi:hypothetical protein
MTMRTHLLAFALVTTVAVTACGDGTDAVTAADQDSGSGVIAVHMEELDGVFVEGFEVGLRFETPDGEVIGSTLWSDFVASIPDASLEAYYDSVLEQDVPAGTVVVLASANVGIGPPPEIPDLDGPLRCRLEVAVPQDGRVDVEVTFDDPDACLRLR